MPTKKKHPLAVRVGANIAKLRDLKGWNQAALGKRLGVGQKRVSEIETGSKALQLDSIDKVARALGTEPFVLLLPEPKPPRREPSVDAHRLVGLLDHCDEHTRGLLQTVMESFVAYGAARKV